MRRSQAWLRLIALFSIATSSFAAQPTGSEDCHCPEPKEYAREPTQQVLDLFIAARAGDEATFDRLIGTVDALSEYGVDGQSLIATLLRPPLELTSDDRERVYWDMSVEEATRIREQHARTLPAKTRMLKRALERGASPTDTSYEQRKPPLHLALTFGTADMVQLLLDAGADPNQKGSENHTPIEFAIDNEFFVRMTRLPRLVDREQLTQMFLALVRAGAKRPFVAIDAYLAKQPKEEQFDRPAADYLLWPALAELTSGTEVLDAFARLATSPAIDPASLSPLAHAARAGNVDATKWLKRRMPRTIQADNPVGDGTVELDLWLDAAIWALHPDPREKSNTDAILKELLVKDMPWEQGHSGYYSGSAMFRYPSESSRMSGDTLLHHLVELRRTDWLLRLFEWGVPADVFVMTTPLAEAVRNVDIEMAKLLLEHGADPLAGDDLDRSPLMLALTPYQNDLDRDSIDPKLVELLVSKLNGQQRARLQTDPPLARLLRNASGDMQLIRTMLDAGLKPTTLDGAAISGALRADDSLLDLLLNSGIRIQERAHTPSQLSGDSSVLVAALRWNRAQWVPRLLAAGANPNHVDDDGLTPVNASLLYADLATFELLMGHGGKFSDTPATLTRARTTSLDYAVASGDVEMLRRASSSFPGSLARACLENTDYLLRIVMQSDDEFWRELETRGFTDAIERQKFCPNAEPVSQRLMLGLLQVEGESHVGWQAQRLAARLRSLLAAPKELDTIVPEENASPLELAHRFERRDLAAVLLLAGATPLKSESFKPASNADKALEKKLPGHYYLYGVSEVGSEILLRKDGRFEYMLAYGAQDELASGRWQVRGGNVMLKSESVAAEPAQPYRFVRAAKAEKLTISKSGAQSSFADVQVTVLGCDAPQESHGRMTSQSWIDEFDAPVCHIILSSHQVDRGLAFAYEVPTEQRMLKHFEFEIDPTAQRRSEFSAELLIEDAELVFVRSGRPMRYRKQ